MNGTPTGYIVRGVSERTCGIDEKVGGLLSGLPGRRVRADTLPSKIENKPHHPISSPNGGASGSTKKARAVTGDIGDERGGRDGNNKCDWERSNNGGSATRLVMEWVKIFVCK